MSAIILPQLIAEALQKDEFIQKRVNSINFSNTGENNNNINYSLTFPYIALLAKEIINIAVFGFTIEKIIINCELRFKLEIVSDFLELVDYLKKCLLTSDFNSTSGLILKRNYLQIITTNMKGENKLADRNILNNAKNITNLIIQVAFYFGDNKFYDRIEIN